jgi:uncharacterized membrane protein
LPSTFLGELAGYTIRDGRPFRWTAAGGFSRMPTIGATAVDINDSGDVVVDMETGATWLPFVWRVSGEVAKIELLPGSKTAFATAINNKGQVVGTFY